MKNQQEMLYENFVAYLDQFHPVRYLAPQMIKYLARVNFPKRHVVVSQGTISNYVYFLEKGLMHAYYSKDDSEVTTWLWSEQQFVTSIQSFYLRKPSPETIETLEPCEAVMIHYDDMMKFCRLSHDFTLCLLKVFPQYSVKRSMRNYNLRALNASERYEALCKYDPDLVLRTPLKIIASYLDISQETLSRIRKKQKEGNELI